MPQRSPIASRRAPPRSASFALPALVLIVDDNADARDIYDQYLRFAGYRTQVAENGQIALERALALVPDVILLDHEMPVLNGADALRRLRADARTAHVPVVMLSAFPLHAHDADHGWNRYLAKPCLPDDVVEAIEAVLDSAAGEHASREA